MGMGAATVELFASCGAKVVVADLNAQLGEALARKIIAEGGQAVFAKVDVAGPGRVFIRHGRDTAHGPRLHRDVAARLWGQHDNTVRDPGQLPASLSPSQTARQDHIDQNARIFVTLPFSAKA